MKPVIFAVLGLFAMLLIQSDVSAEGNCPPGQFPIGGGNGGWVGCAPTGAGGDIGNRGSGGDTGYWEKRWGANALGKNSKGEWVGAYGAADGLTSKTSARKAAIQNCEEWGGKQCKVNISYYNQCGVNAWGDTNVSTASGPTVEVAMELAMANCSKATTNCKRFHSGCGYAERVR